MSTDQLAQVWPWLVALSAPYLGLLKVIQSMYDGRISDRDETIRDLRAQLVAEKGVSKGWEDRAYALLQVAQQGTSAAETAAPQRRLP